MQKEIKKCQNCKQEFTVEPDDFSFYEKMGGISIPKICPQCRSQLRLYFRNERFFYKIRNFNFTYTIF